MTIRRLFNIWTAIAGLLAILAAAALISFVNLQARSMGELQDSIQSVIAAEELQVQLLAHNRARYLEALTVDPTYREDANRAGDALREWAAVVEEHATSPEKSELYGAINRRVREYFEIRRSAEQRGLPPLEVYSLSQAPLDRAFEAMNELVILELDSADSVERRSQRIRTFAAAGGTGIAALVLIMTAMALTISNAVVYRPLVALQRALRRFGKPDWNVRTPEQGPEELRSIAATFNRMAESLGRQHENQLAFLASVAHDLRSPLSVLKLTTEMKSDPLPPPEKLGAALQLAHQQVSRLERMVGDLLDCARIEGGRLEIRPDQVDLRDCIEEISTLFSATPDMRAIRTIIPDEPVHVVVDQQRLEQVLTNLVGNAIKYSPDGGEVTVRLDRDEKEAIVAVTDQGIGVPEEEQELIFEPFRRSTFTREHIPGIGLGLSITRRIVEAHNGRIEVESRKEGGTTFRVHLPLGEDRPGLPPQPPAPAPHIPA